MPHNKVIAEETEFYVQEKLNSLGVHCTAVDDRDITHFDLLVNNTVPIEVKSANIIIKNGDKSRIELGCFLFRKCKFNSLIESDAYFCFVLMYNNERLIAGFKKANEFKKFKRHLPIRKILETGLLTKEEFVEVIK